MAGVSGVPGRAARDRRAGRRAAAASEASRRPRRERAGRPAGRCGGYAHGDSAIGRAGPSADPRRRARRPAALVRLRCGPPAAARARSAACGGRPAARSGRLRCRPPAAVRARRAAGRPHAAGALRPGDLPARRRRRRVVGGGSGWRRTAGAGWDRTGLGGCGRRAAARPRRGGGPALAWSRVNGRSRSTPATGATGPRPPGCTGVASPACGRRAGWPASPGRPGVGSEVVLGAAAGAGPAGRTGAAGAGRGRRRLGTGRCGAGGGDRRPGRSAVATRLRRRPTRPGAGRAAGPPTSGRRDGAGERRVVRRRGRRLGRSAGLAGNRRSPDRRRGHRWRDRRGRRRRPTPLLGDRSPGQAPRPGRPDPAARVVRRPAPAPAAGRAPAPGRRSRPLRPSPVLLRG